MDVEAASSKRGLIKTRETGRFCFPPVAGFVSSLLFSVWHVSVAAAGEEYVMLRNGAYCRTADGRMRVEFVSSDIVRVRYTREADFLGERYDSMRGADGKRSPFSGRATVSGGLSAWRIRGCGEVTGV